jgi:hypothetical protein
VVAIAVGEHRSRLDQPRDGRRRNLSRRVADALRVAW